MTSEQYELRIKALESQLEKMKKHELHLINQMKNQNEFYKNSLEEHPKFIEMKDRLEEIEKNYVYYFRKSNQYTEKISLLLNVFEVVLKDVEPFLLLNDEDIEKINKYLR